MSVPEGYAIWRHSEGIQLEGEEFKIREVRYAVGPDDHEKLLHWGPDELFGEEIEVWCPRNVAFDPDDADPRQWARGPRLPALTFQRLYVPEEGVE